MRGLWALLGVVLAQPVAAQEVLTPLDAYEATLRHITDFEPDLTRFVVAEGDWVFSDYSDLFLDRMSKDDREFELLSARKGPLSNPLTIDCIRVGPTSLAAYEVWLNDPTTKKTERLYPEAHQIRSAFQRFWSETPAYAVKMLSCTFNVPIRQGLIMGSGLEEILQRGRKDFPDLDVTAEMANLLVMSKPLTKDDGVIAAYSAAVWEGANADSLFVTFVSYQPGPNS